MHDNRRPGLAVRDLSGLTSGLERRVLLWLAARMPRAINSDHLTVLALAAMVGAGLSYWLASRTPIGLVLASICLAINWFGDSLDGTLARVRHQQRPTYGFYVDHVVDAFGIAFLVGGLSLSGLLSPMIAAAVLIAYFLLLVEVLLATHVLGTFKMSFFKVGPTELRILLVIGNGYALWRQAGVLGNSTPLFDLAGMIGAAGLLLTAVYSALTNTRRLSQLEPRPEARP
jgi:archaetidylinositol phosphate synthase